MRRIPKPSLGLVLLAGVLAAGTAHADPPGGTWLANGAHAVIVPSREVEIEATRRLFDLVHENLRMKGETIARALLEARKHDAEKFLARIDTAPSRNALDFVSYPGRLAVLFEGRAVAWLGSLAQRVNLPPTQTTKRARLCKLP